MTYTMREKIARAIDPLAFKDWQRRYDYEIEKTGDEAEATAFANYCDTRKKAFEFADAVLAAMREPTEEMVDAGVSADHGGTLGKRAANCWQAMIDAAMNEDKA